MKFKNHTKLDNSIIRRVAKLALRRAECKEDIFFELEETRTNFSGRAWKSNFTVKKGKMISTNKGIFKIKFPKYWSRYVQAREQQFCKGDSLIAAKNLYLIMVHEAKHVADFQQGNKFGDYNKHWRNRPHEIRACITEQLASYCAENDKILINVFIRLAQDIEEKYGDGTMENNRAANNSKRKVYFYRCDDELFCSAKCFREAIADDLSNADERILKEDWEERKDLDNICSCCDNQLKYF